MARRAGKAASRKARQRNVPRQPRPSTPPSAPTAPEEAELAPAPAVEAEVQRPTVPAPGRRPTAPGIMSPGSTLTAAERADYHYVERDLRNIGILSAIMAAMLLGAWLLFTATGIIG